MTKPLAQDRAYSLITIKAMDETNGKRTIKGVATTPDVDRVSDIIYPLGVQFTNPMPLLHQHDHQRPIGTVSFSKPTAKGIEFTAEIPTIDEDGPLKDRVDTAWGEVKHGLVRAVSIGFRPLKYAYNEKTGGYDFLETEVYELSLVTIPANASALITGVGKSMVQAVKSLDDAAFGNVTGSDADKSPRVQGKKSVNIALKGKNMAKTVAERIAALEASKAEKSARVTEIMTKSADEGRTTDAEEQQEVDDLNAEVAAISDDIKRWKSIESTQVASAKAVAAAPGSTVTPAGESAAAKAAVIIKAAAPAAGIRFARYARSLALARKSGLDVMTVLQNEYGTRDPDLIGMVKANVIAVNTTTDSALIGNEAGFADFVEYLRPMTIVGKFGTNGVSALRRVPFRIPLIKQTGASVGYWVGEGKPKPLAKPSWGRTELAPLKAANIAVATMEALRDSSPSAEVLLRDDLAAAIAAAIDSAFIDPTNAGSAGVKPASITNGLSAITSSGNDAAAIREDVRAAMGVFVANENPIDSGVWIMSSTTALALSLMRTALDAREFPGITVNGGTFEGLPVITSSYASDNVVLVNAQDVWFADDGGVAVDMSTEASLQMLDNPTNDSVTPTATAMVSMFQTNSVAFRAERTVNWTRRRDSGVALIEGVAWGQPTSP
jgi:HK97 family phage major capsid protein/HK97 family phage prohead protease